MSMIEDEYVFGNEAVEQPAKRFRYTDSDNMTTLSTPSEFLPPGNGGGGMNVSASGKPSKVLQLRGLPPNCAEIEVITVMRRQAPVVDCFLLSNKGQALVEFECVEDAEHVLQLQHQRQCINISNCVPQITFSPIQSISSNSSNASAATTANSSIGVPGATNNPPSASGSINSLTSSLAPPQQSSDLNSSAGFYSDHHHNSQSRGGNVGSASYIEAGSSDYHHHHHSSKANNLSATSPYSNSSYRSMSTRPDEHYVNGGGARMENGAKERVNKVLLFTILRPDYPIDVKVIIDVCNKFSAQPIKIYIFRRRGVQAMVEFADIETAIQIKKSLDGADIYSGCCTLKIEYARPESLKITRNTEDTYNVKLAEEGAEPARGGRIDPGLLPAPEIGGGGLYRQVYDGGLSLRTSRGSAPVQVQPDYESRGLKSTAPGRNRRREGRGAPAGLEHEAFYVPIDDIGPGGLVSYGRGAGVYAAGPNSVIEGHEYAPSVLMIHNLHEDKFGPQKLFNLLCIFGNVNKVKFLKSKPGSAMVEMQGAEAASKIMSVLPSLECFGKKLTPKISKQQELFENTRAQTADVAKMSNGEPFFVNFINSRDQRFTTANDKAKNRFQNPKKTLHAFNMPAGTTEDAIMKAFEDADAPVPQYVSFMESKYKEEAKKTAANVVFDSITEATEALILANHTLISDSAGRKLTLRLCFSSGKGTE